MPAPRRSQRAEDHADRRAHAAAKGEADAGVEHMLLVTSGRDRTHGRHRTSSLPSDKRARVVATTDWGAGIPQNAGYLPEQHSTTGRRGASAQHKPEGLRQLEACSGEDRERERSCQIQGAKGDGS